MHTGNRNMERHRCLERAFVQHMQCWAPDGQHPCRQSMRQKDTKCEKNSAMLCCLLRCAKQIAALRPCMNKSWKGRIEQKLVAFGF